ncbi:MULTISPECIES: type I phosphomannose isomerase catalytic subunit [Mesonia]|uniref:Mannose-6-phosphate isomerase ManA n=1 Tax=Mesonia oceanica TaxID=2687242 RepID=A0AC61YBL0_9FLAO|nr:MULTISPECIES: type I phosphomannose isomerase catalytic subunit [Mesonia]MAN26511.1 mannose-6-phosphate isomerase [Mesonia sp.]MAQ41170.1 mannose-6-phosphate isomerase [Mesonia sp.]MBJ98126.1 mannose-6-phosphate isomerase [Flavobacteriaceae bacterium]VVV01268.1 Mannose-6-phosphate isomerase ManA [Mesonia oceanica]|tara:strand:+ start:12104 stop:13078 length:975 start_codon:yes stop_codon:yes gene_type:complete
MSKDLYPLKFKPILKEKIWGGSKLNTFLHKDSDSNQVGESWEISDVEGDFSIVAKGDLQGKTLRSLIEQYQSELVGKSIYEHFQNKFPLLIKFIDAKENLSVQLHPDDVLAKKRHNSFGKTEMWYIMQADEGCGIIVGFKDGVSVEDYENSLKNNSIEDLLNFEEVNPGDTFFIKPGLIHAIGKGVVLAEIQQTSDITYRVYDYNRTDDEGNSRQLHTEEAKEAIDFEANDEYKIDYTSKENNKTSLVENQYFKTKQIKLSQELTLDYSSTDSFVIYMNIEGDTKVSTERGDEVLKAGETLLIPACIDEVKITSNNSTLLEVTI